MSLNRHDARRDANEGEIVDALRKVGCSVERMDKPVDLLVWSPRMLAVLLLEVKTQFGELTRDQRKFVLRWRGPVHVVTTPAEALRAAGYHEIARGLAA